LSLTDYDAIIFDLGGVILQLNYQASVDALGALFGQDVSSLYSQAAQGQLFDAFERGDITAASFRRGLVELLPGDHDPYIARLADADFQQAFDRAWSAMLLDIPTPTLRLLQELKRHKQTLLLSNTNEVHLLWFRRDYAARHAATWGPFDDLFHAVYYSHELRQRKPDRAAFEALITRHGLNPARTLFVDDNRHNVAGAGSVGLQAVLHPSNAALHDRFHP
jgi:putative hydrolase of the HAD superfamily